MIPSNRILVGSEAPSPDSYSTFGQFYDTVVKQIDDMLVMDIDHGITWFSYACSPIFYVDDPVKGRLDLSSHNTEIEESPYYHGAPIVYVSKREELINILNTLSFKQFLLLPQDHRDGVIPVSPDDRMIISRQEALPDDFYKVLSTYFVLTDDNNPDPLEMYVRVAKTTPF